MVLRRFGIAGPPLVVFAHPDDETVGAGAQLPHWRDGTFVCVADGSPRNPADATAAGFSTREGYAQARRAELHAALALAGITPDRVRELGRVDQEASFDLVGLAHDLVRLLRDVRPAAVVTHPYEGGHPDHDATAFAVHSACTLLGREGATPPVIEMASYHGAPGRLTVNEFIPRDDREVIRVELSEAESEFKRAMVRCHRSQAPTLAYFPIGVECFRLAPRYDFTRPPHDGPLWYERYDWGITGDRWRTLAAAARDGLGLREPQWR